LALLWCSPSDPVGSWRSKETKIFSSSPQVWLAQCSDRKEQFDPFSIFSEVLSILFDRVNCRIWSVG
jgi:hypothetical protein